MCCKALTAEDLKQIVAKAQAVQAVPAMEDEALERLIAYADGDARRLLNTLETLAITAEQAQIGTITDAWLLQVLGQRMRRYDKGGEQFYDTISALHKSVRGSDPDAALYWLVRMLDGGADPRYMARRIVRMAWEDIGLADPRALQIANDAAHTYERLGSPEGELALAQAVIYLAVAPKSNAGYKAYNQVQGFGQTKAARARAPAPAQCAHQNDEGAGLRAKATAMRTTRTAALRPARTTFPKAWTTPTSTSLCRAAWRSKFGESWRICSNSMQRPPKSANPDVPFLVHFVAAVQQNRGGKRHFSVFSQA